MDNVLIADEDAQFLDSLKKGLDRIRQFNVSVATDMQAAVGILSSSRVAVLVIGLENNALDPLAMLSYMSRNHPITPCIALTGHGKPWFKSLLGQQSFLYYQQKPFDISNLASSIIVGLNLCDLGTNIEGMTMVSLLPLVAMLGRTCRLSVATDDRQTGEMYFQDGVLLDAFCNGQDGEAAARRMAVWNRITFEISDLGANISRKIDTDLMEIADATWNKEDVVIKDGSEAVLHIMDDEVVVLEEVVTDEADEPQEILLSEEVAEARAEDNEADLKMARRLVQKLVMDIRPVKGYQATAIFEGGGDILAADRYVETPDLNLLAKEMSGFCGDAESTVDRMRLGSADALTLHTQNGVVLVQKFVSETGIPLCAMIVCSSKGNWYYFKVRLENLVRASALAN